MTYPIAIRKPQMKQLACYRNDAISQELNFTLNETIYAGKHVFGVWARKTSTGVFDDIICVATPTTYSMTLQTLNANDPAGMIVYLQPAGNVLLIDAVVNMGEWYYYLVIWNTNGGSAKCALAIFNAIGNLIGFDTYTGTGQPATTAQYASIGDWDANYYSGNEAWMGDVFNLKWWNDTSLTNALYDGGQAAVIAFAHREMFSYAPQQAVDKISHWYPLDARNGLVRSPLPGVPQLTTNAGFNAELLGRSPQQKMPEETIYVPEPVKRRVVTF